MIHGEGNTPAEIHATQLRVATDDLVDAVDDLCVDTQFGIMVAENMLAELVAKKLQTSSYLTRE